MSITISNVTISFPNGFVNNSFQTMAVTCAIDGLANGVTPRVIFPNLELSTAMTSTGKSAWAASNTDTYAAQDYALSIAGINVTFAVGDDGSISDVTIQ